MRIVAKIKQLAARYMLVFEFCHDCGVRQPLIWHAPDQLWLDVMSSGRGGIVCPSCFSERARRRGMLILWTAGTSDEEWRWDMEKRR